MIETAYKKKRHSSAVAGTTIVLSVLCFFLLGACSRTVVYPDAPIIGREVVVEAASLEPEVPRFFTYRGGGAQVNFFVLRSGTAVYAFLDACHSCKPRLGYTFRDGFYTCKVCGERYSTAGIKKGIGACYPIKISGMLKSGTYHIPISELRMPI